MSEFNTLLLIECDLRRASAALGEIERQCFNAPLNDPAQALLVCEAIAGLLGPSLEAHANRLGRLAQGEVQPCPSR